jgi:hypothetical protein
MQNPKNNVLKIGSLDKVGMYLLSLWLLFLLIIVNKICIPICLDCDFASRDEWIEIAAQNYLPLICLIFLLVSAAFYFRFKYKIDGAKDGPVIAASIEDKGAEHLVFLATYVIPLVGFGLTNVRETINLAITLSLLGAIYIKTNLFYANPTLALLGFKIFGSKIEGQDVILISREEIESGAAINYIALDTKIYFAKNALRP